MVPSAKYQVWFIPRGGKLVILTETDTSYIMCKQVRGRLKADEAWKQNDGKFQEDACTTKNEMVHRLFQQWRKFI